MKKIKNVYNIICIFLLIPITSVSQQVLHYQVPTGSADNCSIIFKKIQSPIVNGHILYYGDEIGVFNSNGYCAGVKAWNGFKNISIAVWGETTVPNYVQGMRYNEAFQFRVWSVTDQFEYVLSNIIYEKGNGLYTSNSMQVVQSLSFSDIPTLNNAPVLISPKNSSVDILLNENLVWNNYNNSLKYQVQISEVQNFSSFYFDNSEIIDTLYTGNFELYKIYFWRVRANLGVNTWSDWSQIWFFTTGDTNTLISEVKLDVQENYFTIFPNPTDDKINIVWINKSEIPVSIYFINSLGEKILDFSKENLYNKNNYEINLNKFISGTYFCIVETLKNKYSKKFILNK